MALFENIKIELGQNLEQVLLNLDPEMKSYRILRKSLDARKKSKIVHVFTVETFSSLTPPAKETSQLKRYSSSTPAPKTCIIGAGPAGLFAALRLLQRGMPCKILERGKALNLRMRDISTHWRKGIINPDSNVCFGEGGAGTFSDGKLITRIKSPFKSYVMKEFVKFGAPEEILYLSNPHVGSNKIRQVIHTLVEFLNNNGCPVQFNSRVTDFNIKNKQIASVELQDATNVEADNFILATGHSAHDIYNLLFQKNIECESKSMAMGFRIEHEQKWINQTQFGSRWEHPELPVASYALTHHNKTTDTGVYSFCMCPGGYVLASSAQAGKMVVNGMSNYNHGSAFANSGIVVTIDKQKWYPSGAKSALEFQSSIEKKAQELLLKAGGTKEVPAQAALDFLRNKVGSIGKSSSPSGVVAVNLREIYPEQINQAIDVALEQFEKKMPGYLNSNPLLHGIESRTSSPIRIIRNKKSLASTTYSNLFPCGEGAGYAGGITSAAVDGIKVAESIFSKHI